MVDVDFALERHDRRRVVDAAAGKFGDEMTPDQKPQRQSGIDPAGHQQHRPLAGKAEGRRLAGRNRNAVRLDPAEPRQCLHALVIAAAAGAADRDHRVGFIARQCFMQVRQFAVDGRTGFADKARQHRKAGIDQRRRCGAAARDPDARLAHVQFGKTDRRGDRAVDVAHSFAGAAQDGLRRGVAAGRQYALAGQDGRRSPRPARRAG